MYDARRDTLAFDSVLYSDKHIEVTPTLLMIAGYNLPFVGAKEIAVENIDRVWRGLDDDVRQLRWWERLAGSEPLAGLRARLGITRDFRPSPYCLVVSVKRAGLTSRPCTVAVSATNPDKACEAIKHAMAGIY